MNIPPRATNQPLRKRLKRDGNNYVWPSFHCSKKGIARHVVKKAGRSFLPQHRGPLITARRILQCLLCSSERLVAHFATTPVAIVSAHVLLCCACVGALLHVAALQAMLVVLRLAWLLKQQQFRSGA